MGTLARSTPVTVAARLTAVRRTLMGLVGLQLTVAVALSLVDSYRRRGKRPQAVPDGAARARCRSATARSRRTPSARDLYDDMLAAIDGAQQQILFETYIWKGDEVGQRFKTALAAAADRGVEVYCIYDALRQPRRLARGSSASRRR